MRYEHPQQPSHALENTSPLDRGPEGLAGASAWVVRPMLRHRQARRDVRVPALHSLTCIVLVVLVSTWLAASDAGAAPQSTTRTLEQRVAVIRKAAANGLRALLESWREFQTKELPYTECRAMCQAAIDGLPADGASGFLARSGSFAGLLDGVEGLERTVSACKCGDAGLRVALFSRTVLPADLVAPPASGSEDELEVAGSQLARLREHAADGHACPLSGALEQVRAATQTGLEARLAAALDAGDAGGVGFLKVLSILEQHGVALSSTSLGALRKRLSEVTANSHEEVSAWTRAIGEHGADGHACVVGAELAQLGQKVCATLLADLSAASNARAFLAALAQLEEVVSPSDEFVIAEVQGQAENLQDAPVRLRGKSAREALIECDEYLRQRPNSTFKGAVLHMAGISGAELQAWAEGGSKKNLGEVASYLRGWEQRVPVQEIGAHIEAMRTCLLAGVDAVTEKAEEAYNRVLTTTPKSQISFYKQAVSGYRTATSALAGLEFCEDRYVGTLRALAKSAIELANRDNQAFVDSNVKSAEPRKEFFEVGFTSFEELKRIPSHEGADWVDSMLSHVEARRDLAALQYLLCDRIEKNRTYWKRDPDPTVIRDALATLSRAEELLEELRRAGAFNARASALQSSVNELAGWLRAIKAETERRGKVGR
jgi:hypothetical protein